MHKFSLACHYNLHHDLFVTLGTLFHIINHQTATLHSSFDHYCQKRTLQFSSKWTKWSLRGRVKEGSGLYQKTWTLILINLQVSSSESIIGILSPRCCSLIKSLVYLKLRKNKNYDSSIRAWLVF